MSEQITRDGALVRIALRAAWYSRLVAFIPLAGALYCFRLIALSFSDVVRGVTPEGDDIAGQAVLLLIGLALAYPGLVMLFGSKTIEIDKAQGAIRRVRKIAFVAFTRRYKLADLMRVAVERDSSDRAPFYQVRLEGRGLSLIVDSFAVKLKAVEFAKAIAAAIETPYQDLSRSELEDDGSPVVHANRNRAPAGKAKHRRKDRAMIAQWAEGVPTWDEESGIVRFPLPASIISWAVASLLLATGGIACTILFEALGNLLRGHPFGLHQWVGLIAILAIAAALGALALLALSVRGHVSIDKPGNSVERVRLFGFWRRSSKRALSDFTRISVWKEPNQSSRFGLGLAGNSGARAVLARNYPTPDDAREQARRLADVLGLPLEARTG